MSSSYERAVNRFPKELGPPRSDLILSVQAARWGKSAEASEASVISFLKGANPVTYLVGSGLL